MLLCCLTLTARQPDIIILDEPSNNIDIGNMEILTTALDSYPGTLVIVSHDTYFLKDLKIDRQIDLIV
jgi:ATPase subunit of ABC transporter with duplicated ATPase domains